jgi:acyl-coenzyme A thioesterase PaaI-like protein
VFTEINIVIEYFYQYLNKSFKGFKMLKAVPKDKYCFVCGKENKIGLNIDFKIKKNKSVVAKVTPNENYMGFKGVLHGGVISAILDDAMDWAIYAKIGEYFVTSSMTVKFKNPGPIGEELTVEGFCDYNEGKISKIQRAKAILKDKNGNIIAHSEGKFFKIPDKLKEKYLNESLKTC